MLIAIISYEIYKRCYKKKKEDVYLDDHEGETDQDSSYEKGAGEPDKKYIELKHNDTKDGKEVNHNVA